LPSGDPQQTAQAAIEVPEPQTTIPIAPPETNSPPPVAEGVLPRVERLTSNDVVVQPVRVRTVAAEYPPVARAAQIVGNVLLRATVGLDGAVTGVAVVRSVHPLLDQAAKQAVLQYVYTPGMRNAVPEVVTVEITVSFRLVVTADSPLNPLALNPLHL
jgi:TonB family protein